MFLQISKLNNGTPYKIWLDHFQNSSVNFYDNCQTQKFNDTIKGLTIYAEKKYKNGKLDNLYLKKEIKKK